MQPLYLTQILYRGAELGKYVHKLQLLLYFSNKIFALKYIPPPTRIFITLFVHFISLVCVPYYTQHSFLLT